MARPPVCASGTTGGVKGRARARWVRSKVDWQPPGARFKGICRREDTAGLSAPSRFPSFHPSQRGPTASLGGMTTRLPDPHPLDRLAAQDTAAHVTAAGADWLASASRFPRSVHALWSARPTATIVLPCGGVFDVISAPPLFGRRMVDRLWSDGPGSGPVAADRGRILLFAAPGAAQRLPALLSWEEWAPAMPILLCHGAGDAVTIPPLRPAGDGGPRWLVGPGVRHPWLPGPEVLLWACVRAARATPPTAASAPVTSMSLGSSS